MLSSGANHIWRASRERSGYKMPADCSSELRFASILETRFPSYSGVSRFFSRTQVSQLPIAGQVQEWYTVMCCRAQVNAERQNELLLQCERERFGRQQRLLR